MKLQAASIGICLVRVAFDSCSHNRQATAKNQTLFVRSLVEKKCLYLHFATLCLDLQRGVGRAAGPRDEQAIGVADVHGARIGRDRQRRNANVVVVIVVAVRQRHEFYQAPDELLMQRSGRRSDALRDESTFKSKEKTTSIDNDHKPASNQTRPSSVPTDVGRTNRINKRRQKNDRKR